MIRRTLDEAERAGFLRCVHTGQASTRSSSAISAEYELAWDESSHYVKDPEQFQGFFAGEGNRTYIPNGFFDRLIPHEPLAMIQVVGSVIRFSIGFQNKFGHRRQRVALSYRDIQRYAKIKNPNVLARTIREAVAKNYIELVEAGYFDPNGGARSRKAQYTVKWAQPGGHSSTAPKSVAANSPSEMRSEKDSDTTPKTVAADPSEKDSGIQITIKNNTLKQQDAVAAGTYERLKREGFGDRAAKAIAGRFPAERVDRQLRWIDRRTIKSNRLGLLRAAIEQDWSAPGSTPGAGPELGRPNFTRDSGASYEDAVRQTRERLIKQRN